MSTINEQLEKEASMPGLSSSDLLAGLLPVESRHLAEESIRLMDHAKETHGRFSTSYIQRRLRIGYNLSVSILEGMEKLGLVKRDPDSFRYDFLLTDKATHAGVWMTKQRAAYRRCVSCHVRNQSMRKKMTIGGREYVVIGSTIEREGFRVVYKSYTIPGGRKVIVENGKVKHPDGTVTPE